MKVDPYRELDVPRDASTDEIERAYRERAKATHPDAGGTREQWEATRQALVVLSNPKRRRRYDATGGMDGEPDPDNKRADALQVIKLYIDGAIDKFLQSDGTDPDIDPRHRALFVEFAIETRQDIERMKAEIERGKMIIKFVQDVARRVKADDPTKSVESVFVMRIRSIEQECVAIEESIECRQLALEIVSRYEFEHWLEDEVRSE